MIWHYRCPQCGHQLDVDWDEVKQQRTCTSCKARHYAPTPGQDSSAYVGGDRWPRELEEAVVALRGGACIVPGCGRAHTTLVSRQAAGKGGRLSVDNLAPACAQHARDRGDEDYDDWLARVGRRETRPVFAASEITITAASQDTVPVQSFGDVRGVQSVAGQVLLPGPFPAGLRLVFAAPFVPGTAHRLVLYYEWKLGAGESCAVVLGAWPRSAQPDFSKGTSNRKVYTTNEHKPAKARESSALLELYLSESKDELWVAAAWVKAEHEGPVIMSHYLALVTDVPEAEAV